MGNCISSVRGDATGVLEAPHSSLPTTSPPSLPLGGVVPGAAVSTPIPADAIHRDLITHDEFSISGHIKEVLYSLRAHVKSMRDIVDSNAAAAYLRAPDMAVRLTESQITVARDHLRRPLLDPKKPIVLAYGAPGAGKTALIKHLADLINRYNSKTAEFYADTYASINTPVGEDSSSVLSDLDREVAWLQRQTALLDVSKEDVVSFALESRDTLSLVISFNCKTKCEDIEAEEAIRLKLLFLPISARLLYQFFGEFSSKLDFTTFYSDLVARMTGDVGFREFFMVNCSPAQLINHLRAAHGKVKIAIFVDESMYGYEPLRKIAPTAANSFLGYISNLQDEVGTFVFFTGLLWGPFLAARLASGRFIVSIELSPISEDRYAEFFPPELMDRYIPGTLIPGADGRIDAIREVAADASSRYLFLLSAGYPRVVEYLRNGCKRGNTTLSNVIAKAVANTEYEYFNKVQPSGLALGALSLAIKGSVVVANSLAPTELAKREERRVQLATANAIEGASVAAGMSTVDQMISDGRLLVWRQNATENLTRPHVTPMHVLSSFADRVAIADIQAVGDIVQQLIAEADLADPNNIRMQALALAAARRIEMIQEVKTESNRHIEQLLSALSKDSTLFKSTALLSNFVKYANDLVLSDSWLDIICALVADARAMVPDAVRWAPMGADRHSPPLHNAIHLINSQMIERWHARYECAIRQLYADADMYLPKSVLPDYKRRSIADHYPEVANNSMRSALFDWTEPLVLETNISSLPDKNSAESLASITGKLLAMAKNFAGFEIAWVARRVDSSGADRPVLFLEQHKLQRSMRPGSWEEALRNLYNALEKAREAHWDPADVVFVFKSTRPMEVGSADEIIENATKPIWPKSTNSELLEAWNSTTVVMLCGNSNLGKYLGPMLWAALTAGEALGPLAAAQPPLSEP